jgi:hypothetical protein
VTVTPAGAGGVSSFPPESNAAPSSRPAVPKAPCGDKRVPHRTRKALAAQATEGGLVFIGSLRVEPVHARKDIAGHGGLEYGDSDADVVVKRLRRRELIVRRWVGAQGPHPIPALSRR